ncbi:MAG: class I SAM-dependent methyltransferase [Cytophagaceae bacterium]
MAANFDFIASYYDSLSRLVFGDSIHRSQMQFLNTIPENSKVLIIGGGSGRFLKDLLLKFQVRNVLYVEHSAEMIRLSKKAIVNIQGSSAVQFRHGTEEDLKADEVFDVVITPFIFNLFERKQLSAFAGKLNLHLKQGGIWLFSDFKISENRFHKVWQKLLLKTMYIFFKYIAGLKNSRLEKFDDAFNEMGLVKMEDRFFYAGMIYSAWYRKSLEQL